MQAALVSAQMQLGLDIEAVPSGLVGQIPHPLLEFFWQHFLMTFGAPNFMCQLQFPPPLPFPSIVPLLYCLFC